ncbi:hypothetical protein NDU88_002393 [Pleurodeles waltl]|uniref:Uncharacterized protein n=1 Tax=Pleurodeles waltl TaxID=8319 RepID=A0AAV7TLU5_PLEWA|nr:hypothetical protein NDU88_002393 [Pleurodeles waltl]
MKLWSWACRRDHRIEKRIGKDETRCPRPGACEDPGYVGSNMRAAGRGGVLEGAANGLRRGPDAGGLWWPGP